MSEIEMVFQEAQAPSKAKTKAKRVRHKTDAKTQPKAPRKRGPRKQAEPKAKPEPVVVIEPELVVPEGQRFITDDSMFKKRDKEGRIYPHFSVLEVSKVFFGNGPDWFRWRMRPDDKKVKGPDGKYLRNEDGTFVMKKGDFPDGYFVLDGVPIQPKRTEAGARYFTLPDIERMAHALAQGEQIDGAQLMNTLMMVKTCAKMYGVVA